MACISEKAKFKCTYQVHLKTQIKPLECKFSDLFITMSPAHTCTSKHAIFSFPLIQTNNGE